MAISNGESPQRGSQKPGWGFPEMQVLRLSDLVTWEKPQRPGSMDAATYAAMPAQIALCETDISVARDGYRTGKIVLVSTFLDAGEKPVEQLEELYLKRWRMELFFDDSKTTVAMGALRTRTPAMVCRELLCCT